MRAGAAGLLSLLVALASACKGDGGGEKHAAATAPVAREAAPQPREARLAPTSPSPSVRGAARNRVMGTGEAPLPQPFTIEQRLLEEVRQGDRAGIEKALDHGASIEAKDDLRRSTVLLAVLDAGDLELVEWLHDRGAALDEPDVGGRSPLSYAAEKGELPTVRYLVEHGAEVDRRDMQKRTPLFHAALGDNSSVLAYLLDHGAEIDARDQFADTPLIGACAKGNAAAAEVLIERGADRSLRDQEGRTARERAAPGTAPCLQSPATGGGGDG